jgi:hypothetical protein
LEIGLGQYTDYPIEVMLSFIGISSSKTAFCGTCGISDYNALLRNKAYLDNNEKDYNSELGNGVFL